MKPGKSTAIDDYIASFPPSVRVKLTQLRKVIRAMAPDATERISDRMPAFFLDGVLVWYAAFVHHIGFYPGASAIARFKRDLSAFAFAKGSVRFPLDEPLPIDLVRRIVKFRVEENTASVRKKSREVSSRR